MAEVIRFARPRPPRKDVMHCVYCQQRGEMVELQRHKVWGAGVAHHCHNCGWEE